MRILVAWAVGFTVVLLGTVVVIKANEHLPKPWGMIVSIIAVGALMFIVGYAVTSWMGI